MTARLYTPGRLVAIDIADARLTVARMRLMKLIADGKLDPTVVTTHRFELGDVLAAYDVFARAAETNALKVVLSAKPQ
jgi:threonine dehydrogenase-like Zn-dependent dehydrogenase